MRNASSSLKVSANSALHIILNVKMTKLTKFVTDSISVATENEF